MVDEFVADSLLYDVFDVHYLQPHLTSLFQTFPQFIHLQEWEFLSDRSLESWVRLSQRSPQEQRLHDKTQETIALLVEGHKVYHIFKNF